MYLNKTLITGGSGLVGKYLKPLFPHSYFMSSNDYDLTDEREVYDMFKCYKPQNVIHLAAKVGGILDNVNKQADYFDDNVLMNTLVLKEAYQSGVKRFIGILSTCAYPDFNLPLDSILFPLTEDKLHSGPPAKTNFSYGYAKRMLAVQIDAYNQQYGTKYNYLIPCNLYGTGDKEGENSHFLTALINLVYQAKVYNYKSINLFGDGSPLRQFIHASDLAKVIKNVIDYDITESFNVADTVYSINQMVQLVLKVTDMTHLKINYNGELNGQYRKDADNSKLKTLLPDFNFLSLEDGIKMTWNDKISK